MFRVRHACLAVVLMSGAALAQDDGGAPASPGATGEPQFLAPEQEPAPEVPDDANTQTQSDRTIVPAAPSVMGETRAGSVEIGSLGSVEGPVAGTMDDANSGLGYGEWNGVDRAQAEAALADLPPTTSLTVRLLLRKLSPTRGEILSVCARVCSIDMNSVGSSRLNAQVSTTCWPCVLTTLTWLAFGTSAALPLRAGISMTASAMIHSFPSRR